MVFEYLNCRYAYKILGEQSNRIPITKCEPLLLSPPTPTAINDTALGADIYIFLSKSSFPSKTYVPKNRIAQMQPLAKPGGVRGIQSEIPSGSSSLFFLGGVF
jgi:hypothetical protein